MKTLEIMTAPERVMWKAQSDQKLTRKWNFYSHLDVRL